MSGHEYDYKTLLLAGHEGAEQLRAEQRFHSADLIIAMADAIRALRAALQDAETGELKNALAVGQACIELQEERNLNQRAYVEMAELRAALAESERDAGRIGRDTALGRAIEHACRELPEGWTIRIDLERNAGSVDMTDDGIGTMESDGSEPLSVQINELVDIAIAEAMAAQEKAK